MDEQQSIVRHRSAGVAAAEANQNGAWAVERQRWQNPRIRSLLAAVKLLEGVAESNFAILHCSPGRLRQIWHRVQRVADLLRSEFSPLLEAPSTVPRLETARLAVRQSLAMLEDTVLSSINDLPVEMTEDQVLNNRKLLCVSIGKLQAFLQDAFGQLLAADPRSSHDADYFLSKRFARDIEETEWLFTSVRELQHYLQDLDEVRHRELRLRIAAIRRDDSIPAPSSWTELTAFLSRLQQELAPKLGEILALHGIRFDETEILDRYAMNIPTLASLVIEVGETGRHSIELLKRRIGEDPDQRRRNLDVLEEVHRAFSRRILSLLGSIDRNLQDLAVFVPIWLENLERRRALLLRPESRPETEADRASTR